MTTQQSKTTYTIDSDILYKLSEELTDNEGCINTEFEEGDMLVVFEGWYNIEGTTENDYYNGTGASYLTYASVSLTCTVYDAEGYEVANDYTDTDFEKYLLN